MPTTNLFEKVMVFTDLHFGLRHNSAQHNADCLNFIKWMIEEAKTRDCKTCIFMGDYHHHRNNVNAQTQGFMLEGMQLLNDNFDKTYFLVGNHDLYYRENRSVTSSKFAYLFPNIVLVDDVLVEGNVALVPWLVEDEWKSVGKINSKYLFGHLELPGFKMNAQVDMPDHGELNSHHFENQDLVFSGHFHKRQTKGKITYIGNPFGHNFSDVWDFDRGAMYMEWNGVPEYINYNAGPRFINITLSALLVNPDLYLTPQTYLQVVLDIDITYEEATFLRETFISQYGDIREFKLIRSKEEDIAKEYDGDITFQTVDEIVISQLSGIDKSNTYDPAKLIEIYDRL